MKKNELSVYPEINKKFYDIFSKRLNNKLALNYLKSLFKGTLYFREESTVIQNILNGFQRMYEQQKIIKGKVNYKKIETDNIQLNRENRLKFLNNLLKDITDENYFNTVNGQIVIYNLLNFNHQSITNSFNYQKEFKDSILILQYLGVKYLLPEWNIDEKLKKHFEIFKFRDN